MRIISTLLPAESDDLAGGHPSVVMAFDTLVDEKRLVVGITVGSVNGPNLDEVRVSSLGNVVIRRCAAHMNRNYPAGVVVVAGVAQIAGAKERVRHVLAKTPDQAFLLLVCTNDKVYDAAFPALCVDFQSANMRPQ